MNTIKLLLITLCTLAISACGDNNDNSTASEAANDAAANMQAATEEARKEAARKAQELEDLENQ